jgi:hypothetical protein
MAVFRPESCPPMQMDAAERASLPRRFLRALIQPLVLIVAVLLWQQAGSWRRHFIQMTIASNTHTQQVVKWLQMNVRGFQRQALQQQLCQPFDCLQVLRGGAFGVGGSGIHAQDCRQMHALSG